jgi:hypothetical protein
LGVGLTTPPWKKKVTKSEEAKAGRTILRRNGGDGWRRLAEAPEEAQGPHRAVEPMMMMMMMKRDEVIGG